MPRPLPLRAARLTLAAVVATVVAACGAVAPSVPPPSPADEVPTTRPVIIDADMDISDLAAIAILLRDPALDVQAIAIDGTGLVHCAGGMAVTQHLLYEFGQPDIPYGCGREDPGPDGHSFPDEWRAVADEAYGMEFLPRPTVGMPPDAATLLARAIDDSPSAPTIIALGPWTNLEDAFAADLTLADRVAGIHAMMGTIEAPGNVYLEGVGPDALVEWNAYADPSAVSAVLDTDVPIDLIPLDATDDVPVPADLPERLDEDRSAAGADLVYELLLRHPDRLLADQGQQLWDELAALALSDPGLVTWQQADVAVTDQGRILPAEAGRPIRYAVAADRGATEAALLEALRRGGPRATPFGLAGRVDIRFDGTTCTATVEPAGPLAPGVHALSYTGPGGEPSGGLLVGVADDVTWADLETYMADLDLATTGEQPAWLRFAGQAADEQGTGTTVEATATVTEGATYGPVCGVGAWPDIRFTAGSPFAG